MLWLLFIASLCLLSMAVANTCDCCECPTILTDNFATNNLATNYDQRAGTWSVGSGRLTTTSANALVVANNTATTDSVYAGVSIPVQSGTGTQAILAIAYVDDNNYWFARYELNVSGSSAQLKLFERSGGVNTERGSVFVDGGSGDLTLCYANGRVIARKNLALPFQAIYYNTTLSIVGTKCGVGTVANAGTVSFDNYETTGHKSDRPLCDMCDLCTGCNSGTEPEQFQVTIAGLVEGTCGSCASVNGTYICTRTDVCTWRYFFSPTLCDYDYLEVAFGVQIIGFSVVPIMRVSLVRVGFGDTRWDKQGPLDCTSQSLTNRAIVGTPRCDNVTGSATCTVTAL